MSPAAAAASSLSSSFRGSSTRPADAFRQDHHALAPLGAASPLLSRPVLSRPRRSRNRRLQPVEITVIAAQAQSATDARLMLVGANPELHRRHRPRRPTQVNTAPTRHDPRPLRPDSIPPEALMRIGFIRPGSMAQAIAGPLVPALRETPAAKRGRRRSGERP